MFQHPLQLGHRRLPRLVNLRAPRSYSKPGASEVMEHGQGTSLFMAEGWGQQLQQQNPLPRAPLVSAQASCGAAAVSLLCSLHEVGLAMARCDLAFLFVPILPSESVGTSSHFE